DKDDACPNEYGLAEFQGCPDTDGDGVPDKDDACPTVAGPVENNGCPWPDTDGDGILDKDDACPNEYGLAEFQGCPDTDGDGIPDKDDACPTVKGPKENNGCPWTEVHVAKRLSNILFEYNSDKIVPSSYEDVRVAAQILNSDDLKEKSFYIDGHADQRGKDAYNKTLSLKRAQALVNILVERGGVDKARLTARGLGKSQLLCTENTEECYQRNRRVEVLPRTAVVTETKVIKKTATKKK
ncbi:MAG TPA: flagellar motor protein MotB, partial [Flavobacteriaceae bacterium]|nr:flagellar motor protein MotB [Flavobacteriaceae bacterium]